MASRRVSTAVRLFDLRLRSNRLVLAAFVLAFAGMALFRVAHHESAIAIRAGVEAAFSVLLSWAIARELDPDHPASATVAAVAGFLIALTGGTNLGAITALLFAVRIASRSPGAAPAPLDLALLPAVAAYSARSTGGFLCGLALAVALAWDARRPFRGPQALSAVAAAALAIGVAVWRGTLTTHPVTPTDVQWVVLGVALLSVPALRLPAPVSVGDIDGRPLSATRLVGTRALAVATGIATVAWLGGAAAPALVGLWAALVGIASTRPMRAIQSTGKVTAAR